MSGPERLVKLDQVVEALLRGRAPDVAMDALVHLMSQAQPLGGTLAVSPGAVASLRGRLPSYTKDAAAVREAVARTNLLAVSATGEGGLAWARVWLPPPHGDVPVMMFGESEAVALCAAYVEAVRLLGTSLR
jgi:hypothetical protein